MKIKDMLKDYRAKNGITQLQLAKDIKLSQGTICVLEKGACASLLTKAKMSKYFGVSIDQIE